MDYRILGPLQVVDAGTPIDIGSRQQRSLLALLLLHRNRMISTDRIIEALWPDDPVGKERTLWVYISRLRAILEPDRRAHAKSRVLVTRDHGYSLVVEPLEVDAGRFEQLITAGRRLVKSDPPEASRLLRDGLALWHGSVLEEFAYEDFAQAESVRLEELRLVALEDRIDADIRSLRHREVLGDLEKLALEHPHRERIVALLMIALYRSGRQADALRAFGSYRGRVGDELGIEPSPELKLIEEQVLLHDVRLAPPAERAAVEAPGSAANPFKGLRAFGEGDTARFFGRDRMISDLVRRINSGSRLLALVGASGSGKSSVLGAGLVPALRKGAVEGSEEWPIAQMVPGSRPFRELEAALLRSTLDAPESLGDLLDDPEDGIMRACLRLLDDPSGRVAIVIDQFEELFMLGASPSERDRFVRNLEVALDDAHHRVLVAIGLRADFYGRPLEYHRFAQLIGEGIVNVVPLTPDELEVAAQEPAAAAGVVFETPLMVQLLTDVAGRVGGLPMFQFALTELFERRDGGILTLEAYEQMGGCSGVVARRAEDLFLELEPNEREAAKQLFLRLVTIVEEGAWGRRRVPASEIVTIAADTVTLQGVLEKFGRHRLLTFDRDDITGGPTVEVAHEALLSEWPRLRRWIDEGQEDVLHRARLAVALAEWTAADEKPDYLLSGERLAEYELWARVSTLKLGTEEERFLDASILHREQEVRAEEERQARELKLDRQARTRLRGLGIAGVTVAVLLVAGLLAVVGGGAPSIAVVHGVPGDLGVNDLMIAGVAGAEQEHGLEIDLFEVLVDPEELLRDLASSGTDLIIVGSEFDRYVEAVAPDFPDAHWVAIDPVQLHVERANISEMHFEVEDSAFLAGRVAAQWSATGRVGFIGGHQTFRTERSRNGFEQGAAWGDRDVEVTARFIGPVANPLVEIDSRDDLAFELATEMYTDGVDVIFHDAGEAGLGVLRAASEWSDRNGSVWTIGSDADEYLTVPTADRGVVLSSTIKRFDTAVEAAIAGYIDGTLEAGDITLGLADGGVALSRSGGQLAGLEGQLRTLEGEIRVGHLPVSAFATSSPGWQIEPDVTVWLTLTDDACTIDRVDGAALDGERLRIERERTVRFNLSNDAAQRGGLSLRTVPDDVTLADLREEASDGVPGSFDLILTISLAELGGATGGAARMAGSPIVLNCIVGDPTVPTFMSLPLIVSPI